jgi:hypothetical protein
MAAEPRDVEPQYMPGEPRRERRRGERRLEDREPFVRLGLAAAVAFSGGLVVVYLFFWAVGAFSFGQAAAATGIVVALAVLWLGGVLYRYRTGAIFITRRHRERRGF